MINFEKIHEEAIGQDNKIEHAVREDKAKSFQEASNELENLSIFNDLEKIENTEDQQEKTGDFWAQKTKNDLLEEARIRIARTAIQENLDLQDEKVYKQLLKEKKREVDEKAIDKIINTVNRCIDITSINSEENNLESIALDESVKEQITRKTDGINQRELGKPEVIFSGGLAIALNKAASKGRLLSVEDFKRISGDIDLEIAVQDVEMAAKLFQKNGFKLRAEGGHIVDVSDGKNVDNILQHDSWHIGLVQDNREFRQEAQTTHTKKFGNREATIDTPEYVYLIKSAQGREKDKEDLKIIRGQVDSQKYKELREKYFQFLDKKRKAVKEMATKAITRELQKILQNLKTSRTQVALNEQIKKSELFNGIQQEFPGMIVKIQENTDDELKSKDSEFIENTLRNIDEDIDSAVEKKLKILGEPTELD